VRRVRGDGALQEPRPHPPSLVRQARAWAAEVQERFQIRVVHRHAHHGALSQRFPQHPRRVHRLGRAVVQERHAAGAPVRQALPRHRADDGRDARGAGLRPPPLHDPRQLAQDELRAVVAGVGEGAARGGYDGPATGRR
jgi:hypothetical protein